MTRVMGAALLADLIQPKTVAAATDADTDVSGPTTGAADDVLNHHTPPSGSAGSTRKCVGSKSAPFAKFQ